jgi:1,2-phenylacetyl-CoA epoxidase PaaB subunit
LPPRQRRKPERTPIFSVDAPQTEAELEAMRECIRRRPPYGDSAWVERAARQLGLEASLRPRGRPPRKGAADSPWLFGGVTGER